MSEKKEPEIRKSYNPSDEIKEKIRYVYNRKRNMEEAEDRQNSAKDWDKWEKQFESLREDRKADQWQSNHTVPMTFSVIETALSEITDQQVRPLILPRGAEDEAKARIMQRIFDYTWEVSDSDILLYDAIKDALIYGTAITQEYYWKDMRKISELTAKKSGKETKVEEGEEREVADYDDVAGEIVKLQDFYVDERARGFTGTYAAKDCIRRYIITLDDFKRFFQGSLWNPYDSVKYVKPGGDTNYYEYYQPPHGIHADKEVEILWYWSRTPKDRLTIVANDVLIKDGPNPYKHKQLPFVRWTDVRRPHRFYGKGECEILESTQDEKDTMRRMVIDRNHLDIDKMFLISDRLGLTDEDVIARPHGMIPVDDVNAAKPIEYGDIPRSVELSYKWLEEDSIIGTGINPRAQALPTAGTATEAAILKESTLKRLRLKVFLMKKEPLTRLSRLRVANIIQFYSQPKLEKIVGEVGSQEYEKEIQRLSAQGVLVKEGKENYEEIYRNIPLENEEMDFNVKGQPQIREKTGRSFFTAKPEYFMPVARGGYDIKFDAGSTLQISKPLQQAKDLELLDRLLAIALQVPNSYDPVKLGDMVLRSYDKDPNSVKPEQAVQNDQELQLQMQVELAGLENKQMMQGTPVPATPNASPVHTRVHVEFMHSPQYQSSPDPNVDKIFTQHVVEEIMTQTGRAQLSGQMPPEGAMPQGQQNGTVQTSASQGVTNRPGGMAKPSTSAKNIMPSLNLGAGSQ